jgi:hypothetical protein
MAKKSSSYPISKSIGDIERISSDFQCFVCGAIFTTHEDRIQHQQKEGRSNLHDDIT